MHIAQSHAHLCVFFFWWISFNSWMDKFLLLECWLPNCISHSMNGKMWISKLIRCILFSNQMDTMNFIIITNICIRAKYSLIYSPQYSKYIVQWMQQELDLLPLFYKSFCFTQRHISIFKHKAKQKSAAKNILQTFAAYLLVLKTFNNIQLICEGPLKIRF